MNDPIRSGPHVQLLALPGVPIAMPGDDLGALVLDGVSRAGITLQTEDVIVVSSKLVSRTEARFVDLASVSASARALTIGHEIGKDPRFVELILRESVGVSKMARDVLVVRHNLGFICANAGIDFSNVGPSDGTGERGPWALLLPEDPDASASRLLARLRAHFRAAGEAPIRLGIVISDSFGRPFRLGTVGAAIGLAGLPALWDQRGSVDLFGRPLERTITAFADQIAAAADLVAGQAAEGRPIVHVRGVSFGDSADSAVALYRSPREDLYA